MKIKTISYIKEKVVGNISPSTPSIPLLLLHRLSDEQYRVHEIRTV